jgi:hypothetical protein
MGKNLLPAALVMHTSYYGRATETCCDVLGVAAVRRTSFRLVVVRFCCSHHGSVSSGAVLQAVSADRRLTEPGAWSRC